MDIPGNWALSNDGHALTRRLTFDDFSAAFAFLTRVAMACEKADHHADFCVRWNRVDFSLTSHDEGGVTARDVALAKTISAMLGE